MLGCWLAISPFVFQFEADSWLWTSTLSAASLTIGLSLLSYWRPTRHAHLGLVAVALVMIIVGRCAVAAEPSPGFQNLIIIGALLAMLALVPNDATQAPEPYRLKTTGIEKQEGGGR
jgi:hypothetical protein